MTEISTGFLDGNDVVDLGQSKGCFCGDVDDGTTRYVVKNDGQTDRLGNLTKMKNKTFLGRLVVVGSYRQEGIGPLLLGDGSQMNGLGRVVGAGTCHHRHRTCCRFHTGSNHLTVFLFV